MYENSPALQQTPTPGETTLLTEQPEKTPLQRLYPSMSEQPPATQSAEIKNKPAPATLVTERSDDKTPEERMFPSHSQDEPVATIVIPGDIQELRKQALEADPTQRVYPPEKQITAIADDAFDAMNDLTPEGRQELVLEMRRMANDFGMGNAEVTEFIIRVNQAKEVPEYKQREEAEFILRREFGGEEGAAQAVADAKALLNRDPRAKQIVLSLGLGNDVGTIRQLADQARRERAQGRLK